jgi:hypothetical protein
MVAAAVILSACSPVRPTVLDPAFGKTTPGLYPVTVERGKWIGINSVALGVYVDGHLAGTVGGGQALTLYMAAGRHTIGVGNARKDSPEQIDTEVVVDVSESSKPILRTNVLAAGYGGWKIERVSQ